MIAFESESAFEIMLCKQYESGYCRILDEMVDGYIKQPDFGEYGRGDIMTFYKSSPCDEEYTHVVNIFELKIETISHRHLSQLARYKTFFDTSDHSFDVRYHLITKESETHHEDLIFLAQDIEWLSVYEYSLGFDGVEFKQLGGWYMVCDEEDSERKISKMLMVMGDSK